MKTCEKCGTSIENNEAPCPKCGAVANSETSDAVQPLKEDSAKKYTVNEIEERVADYYNREYGTEDSGGRYVVFHRDTTVSENVCKIIVRYQTGDASTGALVYTPFADVTADMTTGELSLQTRTPKPVKTKRKMNYLCLFLLIGCLFIWWKCPFLGTSWSEATALELVRAGGLYRSYFGEMTDAPHIWAAFVSLIGIVVCLIGTLAKAPRGTRTIALLAELPMVWTLAAILRWGDDLGVLGFGFWGIFILLLLVACFSSSSQD